MTFKWFLKYVFHWFRVPRKYSQTEMVILFKELLHFIYFIYFLIFLKVKCKVPAKCSRPLAELQSAALHSSVKGTFDNDSNYISFLDHLTDLISSYSLYLFSYTFFLFLYFLLFSSLSTFFSIPLFSSHSLQPWKWGICGKRQPGKARQLCPGHVRRTILPRFSVLGILFSNLTFSPHALLLFVLTIWHQYLTYRLNQTGLYRKFAHSMRQPFIQQRDDQHNITKAM